MAATSWSEQSGGGTSWTSGSSAPGSVAAHILFVAIILNQPTFDGAIATTFTESSVSATSYTESSISSVSWTEREG